MYFHRVIVAVALCLLITGVSIAQTVPTASFALTTAINANGTLTPTLTWTAPAGATSCTASGAAAWAGTKTVSGTQTLAPFPITSPQVYALVCNGPGITQAMLAWTPPTQNTDGTALTNLAGYRVVWGASQNALTQVAQVAANVNTHTVNNLTAGTWYFGVKAFTSQGMESDLSNIASRVLTGPIEWRQTTGASKPQAPVLE